MTLYDISQMKKGWFVGDFAPAIYQTSQFEVALKFYKAGDREGRHFHRKAHEITVVAKGKVKMNDQFLEAGQIVLISPGESTDFIAIEDTITFVLKWPSLPLDKYEGKLNQ